MTKKMEKYFFESRSAELWGPVDDRSAREVVTKLRLLDADKPGEEIKFFINSPGGIVTSGMVIYDTMRMLKSPVSTLCMGLAASMGSILLSAVNSGLAYFNVPVNWSSFATGAVILTAVALDSLIRGRRRHRRQGLDL